MAAVIDFTKRCVRFVRRHLDSPPKDDFPIDAWTQSKEYAAWFETHRVSESELARQRAEVATWQDRPLLSFIVPLYKTPSEYLHTMVDSVLAQSYGVLELVLVNASPEMADLAREVEGYVSADARVKHVMLDDNYGITENTNRGLAVATGEFCCFLDHDDYLEPDLLYRYVLALRARPEIDVLYCDEDLVARKDDGFVPLHPLFKPDYAPELLLCKNYIVHLMTVRRSIINQMPRPDERYDGAQDYNMVLFATLHARAVHHEPRVLYHWRISAASTAANPDAKPYSQKAYRLSASNRIRACAPGGHIVGSGIVNIHNLWFTGAREGCVSVVVDCAGDSSPNSFLEYFSQTNSYDACEVILVGSALDAELHKRYPNLDLTLVEAEASAGLFTRFNRGAAAARGTYLLFADSTCFFTTPEPLEQLVSLCQIEGVVAAAPKLLYTNGTNRMYGIAITPERIMPLYRGYPDDFPGYQCNLRAFQNASAASVLGLCVARERFEAAGGFDEAYQGEVGSAELCWRLARNGGRIALTPTVKLQTGVVCPKERYNLAVNAPEFSSEDIAQFDAEHPGVRAGGDPYFNKNLDQASGYFQVPVVPEA